MKARKVTTSELVSVGPEMPTLAARAISDPVFANVDPDRADGIQCILRCAHRMLPRSLSFALRFPSRTRTRPDSWELWGALHEPAAAETT